MESDKHLVSIIIPAYNTAEHIESCLKSITAQTHQNLEIIIINDGSTDNTAEILREWAQNDSRIIILAQENSGQGVARNAGLAIFRGEWVCFVDSDDYVDCHYVEWLLDAALETECKMATGKMEYTTKLLGELKNAKEHCTSDKKKVFDWDKYIHFIYSTDGYGKWPMAYSIFHRSLMTAFRFDSIRQGEDCIICQVPYYAKKIAIIEPVVYYYFQRADSTSRKIRKNDSIIELACASYKSVVFYDTLGRQDIGDIYFFSYLNFAYTAVTEGMRDFPQRVYDIRLIAERLRSALPRARRIRWGKILLADSYLAQKDWDKIKAHNKIILYGYGRNGKRLLPWLLYYGVNVAQVWDKTATINGGSVEGIPYNSPHASEELTGAMVLCTIADQTENAKIADELQLLGFENMMPSKNANRAIDVTVANDLFPYFKEAVPDNKLILNKELGICVTEKCTLRCRDCANLMQYFTHPSDCDLERTLAGIDSFFSRVGFVRHIGVIGGEPFIYKKLDLIIDRLGLYRSSIMDLDIITNGTVTPKREVLDSIKRNDVTVFISDYGDLSSKKEEFVLLMKKEGIKHYVNGVGFMWHESNYKKSGVPWSESEAADIFKGCNYDCPQIKNGRLSYCVYMCNGEDLGLFQNRSSIDLLEADLSKNELYTYLYPDRPFEACRYCNPPDTRKKTVPPAIQMKI